jgi:hypothetical protein
MAGSLLPVLAFTVGLAMIVAGVTAIYWPAGPILAGLVTCLGAVAYERGNGA